MMGLTRVLLVDDHALFRESLVRFLEQVPTLKVVGHCATVAEAREILIAVPVDLVLLDYDLRAEAGTHLLGFLSEHRHPARVLMLTAGMTASKTLEALDHGASGIVLKQAGTRDLLEAIRRVAAGETPAGPGTVTLTLGGGPGGISQAALPGPRELTERQRFVLRGILDGLSNKEIGAQLDVSETSVKATVQELFNKAGVRTRGQLVRIAIERFSSTWLMDVGV